MHTRWTRRYTETTPEFADLVGTLSSLHSVDHIMRLASDRYVQNDRRDEGCRGRCGSPSQQCRPVDELGNRSNRKCRSQHFLY